MSTLKVHVQSGIWKGIAAIVLAIVAGLGIWAYQLSREATASWEPMPPEAKWASIRLYDLAVTPPILVAEAQCSIGPPIVCPTEMTFTMPRAAHTFVARGWDGYWESGDSNSVAIPGPPVAPTGLKIKK